MSPGWTPAARLPRPSPYSGASSPPGPRTTSPPGPSEAAADGPSGSRRAAAASNPPPPGSPAGGHRCALPPAEPPSLSLFQVGVAPAVVAHLVALIPHPAEEVLVPCDLLTHQEKGGAGPRSRRPSSRRAVVSRRGPSSKVRATKRLSAGSSTGFAAGLAASRPGRNPRSRANRTQSAQRRLFTPQTSPVSDRDSLRRDAGFYAGNLAPLFQKHPRELRSQGCFVFLTNRRCPGYPGTGGKSFPGQKCPPASR